MKQSLKESIKNLIKERHVTKLPPYKEREKWHLSFDHFDNILAIIWPRRSGKTYFMYQIVDHLTKNKLCKKEDILFLDFENHQLVELKTADLSQLIKLYYEIYGKKPKYLFFDEIQNIDNWWRVLRSFHNEWYQIVVSWSSSKLLLNEISTELRGRYSHKLILPFSFKELLEYNNIDNKTVEYTAASWWIIKIFDEYMQFGWFPKIVWISDTYNKKQELEEYYKTIFYRDIIERYNIQDKLALELLMKYSLDMFGSILVPSKFEQYIKILWIQISKPTILKYLSFLKESFFLIESAKFWRSPKINVMNPKKVYVIDPWFIRIASRYTENKGKVLENIVAIHLFRNEQEFYYFNKDKECDFLVKQKFGLEIKDAIQVTWEMDTHNQDREIDWLIKALESCKLSEGYILTYNQKEEIKKDWYKIHILPVWERILKYKKT